MTHHYKDKKCRVYDAKKFSAGFTLLEVVTACAIGMGVLIGGMAAYLFISKNGRALESQIAFTNQARMLDTEITRIIEVNKSLFVTSDSESVIMYGPNGEMSAIKFGKLLSDGTFSSYSGTEPGVLAFFATEGEFDSDSPTRILCKNVGYADKIIGAGGHPPMFKLVSGASVVVNAYIGDSEELDFMDKAKTGPGRQGINVTIIGTCHNLERSL